ncbi:concanavalin A-like lectin/glucanase domain-containing protein [Aspergillus aurantiobrunneus]
MTRLALSLFSSLLFLLFTASAASLALPPTTSPSNSSLTPRSLSQNCDCYLVSGEDPGYFTNYKLWDFRDVSLPPPSDPSSRWDSATIPLSQTPFAADWQAQSWAREKTIDSTIPLRNSPGNAFFANHPNAPGASQLVLRTTRLEDHASTAEIESRRGSYFHCSFRVRMRLMAREAITRDPEDTTPDVNDVPSGACAGIFTYRSATCEADLEFLTSDPPNTIHYANQPDYDPVSDEVIPGAAEVVTTVPVPWSMWTTHRMDWFPAETRWYADGQLQANVSVSVPDQPSILAMNLWNDGGAWTGDMEIDESVYMGIEWIEVAYNASTAGLPSDETSQSFRLRSSEQARMDDGAELSCERPCYLDRMQYH